MALWRGCEFPEDRLYDVERDVWVLPEPEGTVRIGMTDPAQTRCGQVVHLRIKREGKRVERGKSVATIESAKWVGPIPSPLTGTIVAANDAAFDADILAANRDPYGGGWIVRLQPEDWEKEGKALIPGAEAFERFKARIDELGISCIRCAD